MQILQVKNEPLLLLAIDLAEGAGFAPLEAGDDNEAVVLPETRRASTSSLPTSLRSAGAGVLSTAKELATSQIAFAEDIALRAVGLTTTLYHRHPREAL